MWKCCMAVDVKDHVCVEQDNRDECNCHTFICYTKVAITKVTWYSITGVHFPPKALLLEGFGHVQVLDAPDTVEVQF